MIHRNSDDTSRTVTTYDDAGTVISARNGRLYECLVAHGQERQGTWAPGPATPTVWRDIGPA